MLRLISILASTYKVALAIMRVKVRPYRKKRSLLDLAVSIKFAEMNDPFFVDKGKVRNRDVDFIIVVKQGAHCLF